MHERKLVHDAIATSIEVLGGVQHLLRTRSDPTQPIFIDAEVADMLELVRDSLSRAMDPAADRP